MTTEQAIYKSPYLYICARRGIRLVETAAKSHQVVHPLEQELGNRCSNSRIDQASCPNSRIDHSEYTQSRGKYVVQGTLH